MPQPDLDAVADLIREVAAEVVLPRFRNLAEVDVAAKGVDDPVTVADTEAEALLTRRLTSLVPGSAVLGEEAVSADPSRVDAARSAPMVWVIDPIDGTPNFVAGSPDFAVMVAFVVDGHTTASWIHQPITGRMFIAERGSGAAADGEPLVRAPASDHLDALEGTVSTRLLDSDTATAVAKRATAFGRLQSNSMAAGVHYPKIAEGASDFALYWRTLTWDHAPGVLLVEEAGGRASRLDGTDYLPFSSEYGLVVAADAATCARVRKLLAPNGHLSDG